MSYATGLFLLIAFCLCAVCFDLRSGRIPNALNATGLLAGLGASLASGGLASLEESLVGAFLGALVLIPFFLLRMVGGGDVKFLAAAGSMVGWRLLPPSFLLGALLGGGAGIILLLRRGGGLEGFYARLALLEADGLAPGNLPEEKVGSGLTDFAIPYALPLSLGLVAIYTIAIVLR